MFKTKRIEMFLGLFLLVFSTFGAACSSETKTGQTPRLRAAESPTPEYKPPKRVSRDVIKTEPKSEAVKTKAK